MMACDSRKLWLVVSKTLRTEAPLAVSRDFGVTAMEKMWFVWAMVTKAVSCGARKENGGRWGS
jgi:hypothetical protein